MKYTQYYKNFSSKVAFIDGVKSKFNIVFSILAIAENIRADVYEEFAYER